MRVCYVVSDIDKALAFEWVSLHLPKRGVELSFILIGKKGTALEHHLLSEGIRYKVVPSGGRFKWPLMLYQVRKAMKDFSPDVVHTHLRKATLLGLWAAKSLNVKVRVHTRHHSTFNHQYHPKAVWQDRLCNKWSTHIVAISQNVKEILTEREGVEEAKIRLIHHGFDLDMFENVRFEEVERLRSKYLYPERKGPVIGVISRYLSLKGHHNIIPAFENILEQYPDATLVLANAIGPDKSQVQALLEMLPERSYVEIPFEDNIAGLYKLFDLYIHVPIDPQIEAFGQTYVEALASGVPSVFTLSGVAKEFIKHGHNALVVPFKDQGALTMAAFALLEESTLRDQLILQGRESVQPFALEGFIDKLNTLYEGKETVLQHHHSHL